MKLNIINILIIVIVYFILDLLEKNFFLTDAKMISFLSKDYSSEVVEAYIDAQKKWWYLEYIIHPIIIIIKLLLVAFCLNFIKLLDLPGLEDVKFSNFLFITLLAEVVFIIAGTYKFVNFYWIDINYSLEDFQTYYPMSLINFRDSISTKKWLAYPLQLVNLFELMYWGILAWGIHELSSHKISFIKSFSLVGLTYGMGIVFWAAIVSFLILSMQY